MNICKKNTNNEISSFMEYFYKAFKLNPAPNFISSLSEGRFLDVNDSGLRLLGYTREELIGCTTRELAIWKDLGARNRLLQKLVQRGSLSNETILLRTKHGETKEVLWSCDIMTHKAEKAVLSFLLDISERRKMEEVLRLSEQRLTDMIDFLPDAMFAADIKGRVIAWNKAMEIMTGARKEVMLGKGNYEHALPFYGKRRPTLINLVLNPNRKFEKTYSNFIRNDGGVVTAEACLNLNGNIVCLWGKASLLYDREGNIIGAIETFRDITDRKNMELAIEKRETELEANARELEDLNAALRVIIKQRENDRKELEKNMLSNIKFCIIPNIERLRFNIKDERNRQYLNVLESSLNGIASPFARALTMTYSNLTNREIDIANLMIEAKSSKEIADFLNISTSAVNTHRYRLRKKLGINKRQNPRAILSHLYDNVT